MNTKIATQWVTALRSGNYQQGKRMLRSSDENKFCCLGVLCDIVDPSGWGRPDELNHSYPHRGDDVCLNPTVVQTVGIGSAHGELPIILKDEDSFTCTLAGLNDSGLSFAEIADVIDHFKDQL